MSSNFIPIKIKSILDLIRFDRPIGFALLMWPCWFALAAININIFNNLKWYFLFFIGSFLMRSCGCIVNDLVDIKIDKKIERTASRPLVTKKITIIEAILILIIFLIPSLLILLEFNLKTIILGLCTIPLIIIYPYMKRITYFPQLVLGIVFNWGILIVYMQFNNFITINAIILYIGCIFWTLGYDTIYAYQDRNDDIKINIKSTAIFFDNQGKKYVMLFYIIFLSIIGYTGFYNSGSIISIFAIILVMIVILFFLNKWDLQSKDSSKNYFKYNNFFGLICFIYLTVF